MKRFELLLLVAIASFVMAVGSPACGGKNPPDVTIASTGADVAEALLAVQQGVIKMNANQPPAKLPDVQTRQVLDGIRIAKETGVKLSNALKIYHAATAAGKPATVEAVAALLLQLSAEAGSAFNITVPQPLIVEFQKLTAQVDQTILAIKLELAKGVGK